MTLRVLPWWTDKSIAFIEGFIEFLLKCKISPKVFEFGGGNSTLFFLDKGLKVISCEHDQAWAARIEVVGQSFYGDKNLTMVRAERPYHKKFVDYLPQLNTLFIVVVDGRDRVLCAREVIDQCKSAPHPHILVIDNTERLSDDYKELQQDLSIAYTNSYHFEQDSVESSNGTRLSVADRSGWRAPHRWITSAYMDNRLPLLTTSGRPLLQ